MCVQVFGHDDMIFPKNLFNDSLKSKQTHEDTLQEIKNEKRKNSKH